MKLIMVRNGIFAIYVVVKKKYYTEGKEKKNNYPRKVSPQPKINLNKYVIIKVQIKIVIV